MPDAKSVLLALRHPDARHRKMCRLLYCIGRDAEHLSRRAVPGQGLCCLIPVPDTQTRRFRGQTEQVLCLLLGVMSTATPMSRLPFPCFRGGRSVLYR